MNSAEAVPQSMVGLETVYAPPGRYALSAWSLCSTVKPMPAQRLSRVEPPVFELAATTRRLLTAATWRLPKRSCTNKTPGFGGKDSSFKLRAAPGQSLDNAGEIFAWQHDPEAIGHDEYTFFDNESAGTPEFPLSRAATVKLDTRNRVATLVASDDQPEGLAAPSQGNAQTTPDGGLFVGWGALPYFSEFDPSGRLVFNAEFPTGVNTYRAYVLPWHPGEFR